MHGEEGQQSALCVSFAQGPCCCPDPACPCVGESLGHSGSQFGSQGGKKTALNYWEKMQKNINSIVTSCLGYLEKKSVTVTVFHQPKLIILVAASLGRRSVSIVQNSLV